MNAVMDLEQLLIMYSRVVDAPRGSEEYSTAVREIRDAIDNDAAHSDIPLRPIPPSHTKAKWNGEERRRKVLPKVPVFT